MIKIRTTFGPSHANSLVEQLGHAPGLAQDSLRNSRHASSHRGRNREEHSISPTPEREDSYKRRRGSSPSPLRDHKWHPPSPHKHHINKRLKSNSDFQQSAGADSATDSDSESPHLTCSDPSPEHSSPSSPTQVFTPGNYQPDCIHTSDPEAPELVEGCLPH
ncbi:hypothetical protein JOM56_015503 [Amanita muscaria]